MSMPLLKHLQPRPSRAFSCVCLLLVFSFLFNPYLTAQVAGSGLSLRHPVSHRATVGSSELEKYSPVGAQDAHGLAVLLSGTSFMLAPAAASFPMLRERSEPFLLHPYFCASLWFRPPPVL